MLAVIVKSDQLCLWLEMAVIPVTKGRDGSTRCSMVRVTSILKCAKMIITLEGSHSKSGGILREFGANITPRGTREG